MVQLNTYNRAIVAIGSPDCDIPNPALFITEDTVSSVSGDTITCTGAQFVTKGVKVGDIVYCFGTAPSPSAPYPPSAGYTVVKVVDEEEIIVNNTVTAGVEFVKIFGSSEDGCVICITENSAQIQGIITVGGDYVDTIIYGPGGLSYGIVTLPIQVKKVENSSTPFIALW
jgi:hypothetical protein